MRWTVTTSCRWSTWTGKTSPRWSAASVGCPGTRPIDIARQICAGLAAAHVKGVLHRDLKPQNVMLDGRGNVRITDFGLAGLAETIQGDDVRSGTPAYMSPEQLAGREVTVRSDIYALGLVLYELLHRQASPTRGGRWPRSRSSTRSRWSPPSDLVADIAPEAETTILRCLESRSRPPAALGDRRRRAPPGRRPPGRGPGRRRDALPRDGGRVRAHRRDPPGSGLGLRGCDRGLDRRWPSPSAASTASCVASRTCGRRRCSKTGPGSCCARSAPRPPRPTTP